MTNIVTKNKRPRKEFENTYENLLNADNTTTNSTNYNNTLSTLLHEILNKEFHCVICHEILINSSSLSCGHIFCAYCINLWLKRKPCCPLCLNKCHKYISLKNLDNFISQIYDSIMPNNIRIERHRDMEFRKQEIFYDQSNKCKQDDEYIIPSDSNLDSSSEDSLAFTASSFSSTSSSTSSISSTSSSSTSSSSSSTNSSRSEDQIVS